MSRNTTFGMSSNVYSSSSGGMEYFFPFTKRNYSHNQICIWAKAPNNVYVKGKKISVTKDTFITDTINRPLRVWADKPIYAWYTWTTTYLNLPQGFHISGRAGIPALKLLDTFPKIIIHESKYNMDTATGLHLFARGTDTVWVNGKPVKLPVAMGNNAYYTFHRTKDTLVRVTCSKPFNAFYLVSRFKTDGYYSYDTLERIDAMDGGTSFGLLPENFDRNEKTRLAITHNDKVPEAGEVLRLCRNATVTLNAEHFWNPSLATQWYINGNKTDTGNKLTYTPKDTGWHNIMALFLYKHEGCTDSFAWDTAIRQVYVYPDIQVYMPKDTLLCSGVPFVYSNMDYSITHRWVPIGFKLPCDTCRSIKAYPANNSILKYRLNKAGCNEVFKQMTFKVKDSLKSHIQWPDTVCYGSVLNPALKASGGDSTNRVFRFWADNKPITLPYQMKSSFGLTAILSDGCSVPADSSYRIIFVRQRLRIPARPDTLICAGSSYSFATGSVGGYKAQPVKVYVNGKAGVFPFTLTDSLTQIMATVEDGCSLPDTLRFTVRQSSPLQLGGVDISKPLCWRKKQTWLFTGNGGDTSRYVWSIRQNGNLLDSGRGRKWQSQLTLNSTADMLIRLENACGYIDTILAPEFGNGSRMILEQKDTFCAVMDTLRGSVSTATAAMVYLQDDTGTDSVFTVDGKFEFILKPVKSGMYSLWFSDGCSAPDTTRFHLQVSAPLLAKLVSPVPDCGPATVMPGWQLKGGIQQKLKSVFIAPGIVLNGFGGKYTADSSHWLHAQITDGCTAITDSVWVRISPDMRAMPAWKDTIVCSPWTFEVSSPVSRKKTDWIFKTGDGSIYSKKNIAKGSNAQFVHTYNRTGDWVAELRTFSDSADCLQASRKITVSPNPVADFTWSPPVADIHIPQVQFNNQSAGGNRYDWNLGNGVRTNVNSPVTTYKDSGTYFIRLSVWNSTGCVDSIVKRFYVWGDLKVWIPTGVVPAGINKEFMPVVVNGVLDEIQVYNKWGEKVYRGKGPWRPEPHILPGVYAYYVRVYTMRGRKNEYKGTLHVLR
ncbi:MAG: hypothetical protein JNL57_03685 [Bacteroidetes bacterium]|nr:hypothetical protein [Bacteroidota bacterium]